MGLSGVVKNFKRNGLSWTLREIKSNHIDKYIFNHYIKRYRKAYLERPFKNLSGVKYQAFMSVLKEEEDKLKKSYPKYFKQEIKDIKSLYIKERIPETYNKYSKGIIENKVICLENGNSPSPSSFHVGAALEKKGYDVHYTGLKIRQVSEIEYFENALAFVEDMATAKAVFLSTANDVMSHFDVRDETKVIQLWHGVGVFKKIGYSTTDKAFGRSAAARKEYDQYRNYSYVTIPSMEQAWIFEDAMHITRDSGKLVPVGVSRTDVFYDPNYIDSSYRKFYEKFPDVKGKKIILYAPTFRGNVATAKAPDKLNVRDFADALSDDYILLIKHHGLAKDIPPIPDDLKDKFAFDMGKHKLLGIERLLTIADICITDYSSIAFEFSIMERPIIFFAYDLDEYLDERGMYYSYEEITPGPVCKTNHELIDYIANIDKKFDKQKIIDFKNKYVSACDGHATERTIALIDV